MLPKYENYLTDIAHYIINRVHAESEINELIDEVKEKFKFEIFVPEEKEILHRYVEYFVRFCVISHSVAMQMNGE